MPPSVTPGGDAPAVGFDPPVVLRLRSALGRFDPDVVVAHGSEPLKYLVPAMLGRRQAPGVLRHRHVFRLAGLAAAPVVEAHWWAGPTSSRRGRGGTARVHRPSRRSSRPGGPRRRMAVTRPVPSPDGEPGSGRGVPGRLTSLRRCPHRGQVPRPVRARSLPDCAERGVALTARLVGDGPLREALAGPAEAAGVAMLGYRPDIPEQLRAADVLVFPSRPAGEGMPGVLIEAALSGLPGGGHRRTRRRVDREGRCDRFRRAGRRSGGHDRRPRPSSSTTRACVHRWAGLPGNTAWTASAWRRLAALDDHPPAPARLGPSEALHSMTSAPVTTSAPVRSMTVPPPTTQGTEALPRRRTVCRTPGAIASGPACTPCRCWRPGQIRTSPSSSSSASSSDTPGVVTRWSRPCSMPIPRS